MSNPIQTHLPAGFFHPSTQSFLGYRLFPKMFGHLFSTIAPEGMTKEQLHSIPSETTTEERVFLYNFFANVWSGKGDVLEIGPFIGGTTRAMAMGMLENVNREPGRKLITHDSFIYREGEDLLSFLEPLFANGTLHAEYREKLLTSPDVLDLFHTLHDKHAYGKLITAKQMTLPSTKESISETAHLFSIEPNATFDAVFIDGCKRWYATKYFMIEIIKSVRPGAFFICQDYGWPSCFYLPVFFALFRDYFHLTAFVDSTYVFQLSAPLDQMTINARYPDTAREMGQQVLNKLFLEAIFSAGERGDVRALVTYELQRAVAFAYLEHIDEARAIIQDVSIRPYAIPYQRLLQAATSRITEYSTTKRAILQ